VGFPSHSYTRLQSRLFGWSFQSKHLGEDACNLSTTLLGNLLLRRAVYHLTLLIDFTEHLPITSHGLMVLMPTYMRCDVTDDHIIDSASQRVAETALLQHLQL
jgi:hypothetical protein